MEDKELSSGNNFGSGSSSNGTAGSRVQELLALGRALQEELRARWEGRPGIARLQKLVRAELSFLTRLVALPLPSDVSSCPALRSSNLDHLVNVLRILQHPHVDGVSAVMQNLAIGGPDTAHVDTACTIDGKPVWLILSSRNPRYIRWMDTGKHVKGLKARLLLLLHAACADIVRQPESIFLCFAGRVPEVVDGGLKDEFGAIHVPSVCGHKRPSSNGASPLSSRSSFHPDYFNNSMRECELSEVEGGDWLEVEVQKNDSRWNHAWETYEIRIQTLKGRKTEEPESGASDAVENEVEIVVGKDSDFCSLSSPSQPACDQQISVVSPVQLSQDRVHERIATEDGQKLVNLDTTALVALVSELSNGGAEYLLALPQEDLEKRFPSMSAFIREQALSELDKPLLSEMEDAMAFRQPIVSRYVHDEFCSIVSQIGGSKEKDRAKAILQRIRVVPDRPSNRVMSLPFSGRIKRRHKIVFGTGDFFNAPTLTANLAFVRAAMDKGMPIATLEHRPRALTGD